MNGEQVQTGGASGPSRRTQPVEERLDTAGIWAFESHHGDAFTMDFTRHDFWKWLLLTRGGGVLDGDWGQPVCVTGDLVVIPPGLRHRIVDHPRQAISLYGLGIAPSVLAGVPDLTEHLPSGVLSAADLAPLRLKRRMRRLLYTHGRQDPLHRLATVAAAVDLVAEVSLACAGMRSTRFDPVPVGTTEVDPMLESYLAWLENHFFESLRLDDGAAACGMSRRGFTSAFRKRTGRSWLDHVNRLRVGHAMGLLRTTDRKLASLAFRSGFDDLSTFYRAFHRITGKRPGDWRTADEPLFDRTTRGLRSGP